MNDLVKCYPELAKVQVIGRSYLGKDLHLMEITNPDTGPALAKPVLVRINLRDAVLLDGKEEVRLGHIPGRATVSEEGLFSETVRSASWVLKKAGPKPSVTISAVSEKGGKDEKAVLFCFLDLAVELDDIDVLGVVADEMLAEIIRP
jgi:Zinc carboxypeptidase